MRSCCRHDFLSKASHPKNHFLWVWANFEITWAVVVVQWSALSPTAPKIRVRIPLASKCSLLYEKTKINKKEAGVGPFKIFLRL